MYEVQNLFFSLLNNLATWTNFIFLIIGVVPWLFQIQRNISFKQITYRLSTVFKSINSKLLISLFSLGALYLQLVLSKFIFDTTSLALFFLSITPWITSLITSAKLPGGVEISFRDIEHAVASVEVESKPKGDGNLFAEWNNIDQNLALVALRIEIEKRVRTLAQEYKLGDGLPLSRLLRILAEKDIIPLEYRDGLLEVTFFGNKAAHGAEVNSDVNNWAYKVGPKLLQILDSQIRKDKKEK
ncbi:hypothetical protein EHO58_19400 [Leptospira selangorensis]|nr:hypothetical protein EHO58_19400 [Leptospira selangorensis]